MIEELQKLRFGADASGSVQRNGDMDVDDADEVDDEDEEEEESWYTQDHTIRVLDLGTGNGHMLFSLRDSGWVSQMVGVDYSPASVFLARQIQRQRLDSLDGDPDARVLPVQFELFDILNDKPGSWLGPGFDIVLDKGTFDAISLNPKPDKDGRKGFELYGKKVESLVRPGGYLLITSCNWTEEELRRWFESEELEYWDRIKYRSFTYAGVKGQTISSVFFRRRDVES